MRTIQQMVQQEVMCCMSSLVSTMAQSCAGPSQKGCAPTLRDLCSQASELASSIPDYEEAAIQAGWSHDDLANEYTSSEDPYTIYANISWQELCEHEDIKPYDREVFEHWAVTSWLADKLIEQGEKVDTDFGGLCVWARTTTGQLIEADGVIERIYVAMMEPA